MGFQDSRCNICVSDSVILAASVFETSCGKQTTSGQNSAIATDVNMKKTHSE